MSGKSGERKSQFLEYLLGGGTSIYAVGLLGACAYNGLWDDDNYWRNYQLGRQFTIHQLAVSIIVLSIVSILCLLCALAVRFSSPDSRNFRLVSYIVSFVVALGVIGTQGYALWMTTYGDYHVSSEYDYYNSSSEFKEYYDKYGVPNPETFGSLDSPVLPDFDELLEDQNFTFSIPYKNLDWSEYFQEYANTSQTPPNGSAKITPCVFNWGQLATTPMRFLGGDPCMFSIGDEDALACIGGWSGKNFQRFWCYASRKAQDEEKWREDRSFSDLQKRDARAKIGFQSVDSLSAFYRHNVYMVSILSAAFVISLVSVILDHVATAPKPASPEAVVKV
jgi:hypothetical protein